MHSVNYQNYIINKRLCENFIYCW